MDEGEAERVALGGVLVEVGVVVDVGGVSGGGAGGSEMLVVEANCHPLAPGFTTARKDPEAFS